MADFSVQIISAFVKAVSTWLNSMLLAEGRNLVIRFNFDSISTFYSGLFDWEKLFKEIKDLFQTIIVFDLYHGLAQPIDQQKMTQRLCGILYILQVS